MHTHATACVGRSEDDLQHFSPSTAWVLGIKLRHQSGLQEPYC